MTIAGGMLLHFPVESRESRLECIKMCCSGCSPQSSPGNNGVERRVGLPGLVLCVCVFLPFGIFFI